MLMMLFLMQLQQRMWPHMKMADMHAMYEACAYELLTRPEGETEEPLVSGLNCASG